MSAVKIYLADDHTMFRKALINMIDQYPMGTEIKEAGSGRELLNLVEEEIPDVAIIDLEMPGMDGFKVIERLKESYPEVRIIVLTSYSEHEDARKVLKLGADVFISKCMMPDELMEAIRLLASGGRYFNCIMLEALSTTGFSIRETINHFPKVELSEREYAIVELLCREFTNKQIGYTLSLSENTIRNHKVRIMRKAGVKNTPGLVKLAFQNMFTVRKR